MEMVTLSSILAWKIPWTEEPGGLQSIGLQGPRFPALQADTLPSELPGITNEINYKQASCVQKMLKDSFRLKGTSASGQCGTLRGKPNRNCEYVDK